jgi:lipopolysaccharide transport system ATP-binding protein
MAISFRAASFPPLEHLTADVPGGAIVGVIGEESPALSDILRLAAGVIVPTSGQVEASEPRRYISPVEPLNLAPAGTLAIDRTLSLHDALVRVRSRMGLERLRRTGASILICSHEQDLLRDLCDEVWWLHGGSLVARGEPREVLTAYNTHLARTLHEWAASMSQTLQPSLRRGDGRARLLSLETLDAAGNPSLLWRSGEPAAVRVRVRFEQPVEDPVVGILIRTRIGFEVFGTNTELEGVKLGPVQAGETLQVTFSLRCDLCPQEYTLTAASHDPDGVWHDWVEDALAFTVADTRYTAGVANLRAAVSVTRG